MTKQFFNQILKLQDFTVKDFLSINNANILVIGAGGLAHPLLTSLLGHGIKNICIADDDIVEESNLHRQFLFDVTDIGTKKVKALEHKLSKKYPDLNIQTLNKFLEEKDIYALVGNFDLVIDCSDNFMTRYNVNEICYELKVPLFMALANGYLGHAIFFKNNISGPCYECIFPRKLNVNEDSCDETGIVPAVLGYISSLIAILVIKFICNEELNSSILYRIDAKKLDLKTTQFDKDPLCICCKD